MNILNKLPDSKIESMFFQFDAENINLSQNLIIHVVNLHEKLERYELVFNNVSSFCINIETGDKSIYPNNYAGDCLYIEEIICLEKSEKHEHWQIKLIDDVGYINVFSNKFIVYA